MTGLKNPQGSGRYERMKKIAAVLGIALVGPAAIAGVAVQFMEGEFRSRGQVFASSVGEPVLFYSVSIVLGIVAFALMLVSMSFIVKLLRSRTRQ